MLKKNDLIQYRETFYRVLSVNEKNALLIDCMKRTMPIRYSLDKEPLLQDAVIIGSECLQKITGKVLEAFADASPERQNTAYKRFSMIAGIIPVIDNRKQYINNLDLNSEISGVTKQTIRRYLCDYLVFQNMSCLLPAEKASGSRELTDDEKNFRWALNRWFYTQNRHSLNWTYNQMIREKYCDQDGKLLQNRPTFNQFRYYYRQNRNEQNYLISRNGLGDYNRNERPLLGDCIQAAFPNIGTGMLDSTVADVYIISESGSVIGRPIITACIDAHTSLCCGYTVSLEGGTYSLRNLMLQTISDKVEWCKKYSIVIEPAMWPCSSLPGVMITDNGKEYISENFLQITEAGVKETGITDAGVTVISNEAFAPHKKPVVEKFFDCIGAKIAEELKGSGYVDKDFGERTNRIDYRKQACLTLRQFEGILIRTIIYYNSKRTLENYPFTEEQISSGIVPTAAGIWNHSVNNLGTNLISISKERLSLILLPRTSGRFARDGLRVNRMRYVHTVGNYTNDYLVGRDVIVAYSPDNASRVWLVENGGFIEFRLIESRYKDMTIEAVQNLQNKTRQLIKKYEEVKLQGEIDLSNHIRNILQATDKSEKNIAGIRENRQKEKLKNHIEIGCDIQ